MWSFKCSAWGTNVVLVLFLASVLIFQGNANVWDNLFSRVDSKTPTILFPEEFLLQMNQKFNLSGVGEAIYNVSVKYSGKLRLFELEDNLITTGITEGNFTLSQIVFDMNKRQLSIKNLFSGCRTIQTNKYMNLVFDNMDALWRLGTLYKGMNSKGQHIFTLGSILESLPGSQKFSSQVKDLIDVQAFFDKQTERLHKLKVAVGNATFSFLTEGLKEMEFKPSDFTDPSNWECSRESNTSSSMKNILESFGGSALGLLKSRVEGFGDLFMSKGIESLLNMNTGIENLMKLNFDQPQKKTKKVEGKTKAKPSGKMTKSSTVKDQLAKRKIQKHHEN